MKSEEDKSFVRLFCHNCDNVDCNSWRKLGYISDLYKQGCSREVSFDDFVKYEHYVNEEQPFWPIIENENLINEQYFRTIDFLDNVVFKSPIKNFFDKKGKVVTLKEIDYVC